MTRFERWADTARPHPFASGFHRAAASLLIALIVATTLGGLASHAAAATPATNVPKTIPAQATATAHLATSTAPKPTASLASTPTPTAAATAPPTAAPRAAASPLLASSPSPVPFASPPPTATASPTVSAAPTVTATATRAATVTPPPPASSTPSATAAPTGVATPSPSATAAPAIITRLFVPTDVPATPPPPPGPSLALPAPTLLDTPAAGANPAVARAALKHFGEFYRPDGVPWVGWCEMFAGNVLAEAGLPQPRYPSAIADALSGPLYRGTAPAGSLVFFDQRASPYGHVGVALGDGTMVSALGGGVVRTGYGGWVSYLGWRPYGASAPADAPINLQAYNVTAPDEFPVTAQSSATTPPNDATLHVLAHAGEFANAALDRLATSVPDNWNESPPYRSPQRMMK